MRLAALASLVLTLAATAAAQAEIDRSVFRYERPLTAAGDDAVVFEPDGPLFAHARFGFSDLRIVDARGEQVPWRRVPERVERPNRALVLNSGREGNRAVALLDLGRRRAVRDRIFLEIPDRDFVGRVVVLGSDTRGGPFTRLSATGIYDVAGFERSRSTTVLFPPSDFRFLRLEATGVSRITGATVSGAATRPRLVERFHKLVRREESRATVLTLDFGFHRIPVDELRIMSRTRRYDRPVSIDASGDGRVYTPVTAAQISRFPGSSPAPIPLGTSARYLRVTIRNGDDEPLADLRVLALADSRAVVLEPGHRPPYVLLYGSSRVRAPSYEFARLPFARDTPTVSGRLGAERLNAEFEPPPDTRSFAERHGWLVQVALAVAALAVGAAGFLALRRRA